MVLRKQLSKSELLYWAGRGLAAAGAHVTRPARCARHAGGAGASWSGKAGEVIGVRMRRWRAGMLRGHRGGWLMACRPRSLSRFDSKDLPP